MANRIPAEAGIDLQQALSRLGNDHNLLRDLARIFIEDAPGLLSQTAAGNDAADSEAAARSAHSLKGLAANFSAAAANAAQAVEAAIRSGDRARIDSNLAILRVYIERLTAELDRLGLLESRDESRE